MMVHHFLGKERERRLPSLPGREAHSVCSLFNKGSSLKAWKALSSSSSLKLRWAQAGPGRPKGPQGGAQLPEPRARGPVFGRKGGPRSRAPHPLWGPPCPQPCRERCVPPSWKWDSAVARSSPGSQGCSAPHQRPLLAQG